MHNKHEEIFNYSHLVRRDSVGIAFFEPTLRVFPCPECGVKVEARSAMVKRCKACQAARTARRQARELARLKARRKKAQ